MSPGCNPALKAARQICDQDVETERYGEVKLRKGVAKNCWITIEDEQMRHGCKNGRKDRTQRFNGYKRHILKDLDTGLIRAVGITEANTPEARVTEDMATDLDVVSRFILTSNS